MKIPVSKEHIKRGTKDHFKNCPIALAIRDFFGEDVRVTVGGTTARIGQHSFDLPNNAVTFIKKFDKKKSSVKPFILEI